MENNSFEIEKRQIYGNDYLKVFLRNENSLNDVAKMLCELPCVKKANVTDNQQRDITVYPARTYNITELENGVREALNAFFSDNTVEKFKDIDAKLSPYPKVKKIVDDAFTKVKMNNASLNRNILDDMRLSLELLLREVLRNSKSLEKQTSEDIGLYLKNKGKEKEIRSMFSALIDYYTKYQDKSVKHNCVELDAKDINLITNLTLNFMDYLV